MDDTTNGRSPSESRPIPTLEGRVRLAAALAIDRARHPVDGGTLGEYVELLDRSGLAAARDAFPAVAAHLAAGCDNCNADVHELRELAALGDIVDSHDGSSEHFRSQPTASGIDRPFGTMRGVPGGLPSPAGPGSGPSRREPRTLVVGLMAVAALALVVMGGALLTMLTTAQRGGTGEIKLIERGSEEATATATSSGQIAPPVSTDAAPRASPPAPTGTAGSVASNDGECSDLNPIKANRDSRIYHLRGGQFYERTRAELCFVTTEDAERAGYRRSQR